MVSSIIYLQILASSNHTIGQSCEIYNSNREMKENWLANNYLTYTVKKYEDLNQHSLINSIVMHQVDWWSHPSLVQDQEALEAFFLYMQNNSITSQRNWMPITLSQYFNKASEFCMVIYRLSVQFA